MFEKKENRFIITYYTTTIILISFFQNVPFSRKNFVYEKYFNNKSNYTLKP